MLLWKRRNEFAQDTGKGGNIMTCCTFAGHREVYGSAVEESVLSVLEKLVVKDEEFCFYVGGMGEFDAMAARAVRRLKQQHPEKKIQLVLVLPYMKQSVNENKLLETLYDEIVIPMELEGCHYRSAIQKRNCWIVDRCSQMICFIQRDFGGAYATYQYAKRKGLDIINVAGKDTAEELQYGSGSENKEIVFYQDNAFNLLLK